MNAQNKNEGKVKWALIFKDTPNALLSLARVAEKSIKKYSRLNWSESIGKPDSARFREENLESIIQHAQALLNGEELDQETGEHHGGHIMRRASFCVEYYVREKPIEHPEYQEDPAWEIDQLVTWLADYRFWYFNEHGFICYGHFAPKFNDKSTLHSVAHHMTVTMVPEHLRKYWKESVRKRKIDSDYAWEIDQIVEWHLDYQYWYFDEKGYIFLSNTAPEFSEEKVMPLNGRHCILERVPSNLRKYWKESLRKKS